MTTPTTATSAIDLPLGTTFDGAPVSWRLTDTEGRPQHGLIVGPMGSGGTTALARLCRAARGVDADIHPAVVDLDHGPDYYDPAWKRTLPGAWCKTDTELVRELGEAHEHADDVVDGLILLLVDGDRALRTDPAGWERLLQAADRLHVAVVARVHSVDADHLGSAALREGLLACGQYLALGRPMGTAQSLAQTLLPGYAVPAGRQKPGRGVYGYRGDTVPVVVSNPR